MEKRLTFGRNEIVSVLIHFGKKIGYRAGEVATLNNLGLIYRKLGQDHKAIEYYQQSLVIYYRNRVRGIGDHQIRGGERVGFAV